MPNPAAIPNSLIMEIAFELRVINPANVVSVVRKIRLSIAFNISEFCEEIIVERESIQLVVRNVISG